MTHPEAERIRAMERREAHWRRWGPYLSGRQWGTVREDYSADGNAWDYFPFDMAHVRAYRWGEDGLLGISDNHQRLCFAPAFWNGNDRILKERLFGLGGHEGNHGEDVKECWFHLDNVPSHAYMKALYKYPQRAFPYDELRRVNRERSQFDPEYELVDTGIFADDAYFDIVVEYAKQTIEDIHIRITVTNRGRETAPLHVLPTLWFRNEWAWKAGVSKPQISDAGRPNTGFVAQHATLGRRWMFSDGANIASMYTDNETDFERAFGVRSQRPYTKDAFHRLVIEGDARAVNPKRIGTKAAFHYVLNLAPGATETIRLRLTDVPGRLQIDPEAFDAVVERRIEEADTFYRELMSGSCTAEDLVIQRRSIAGLLWCKQFYNYIIRDWLKGDPLMPQPPPNRVHGRNASWTHLYNDQILSMPDEWEYPWYASWDLAFHVIALALVDSDFAKNQMVALTRERYMHPNGQIPAYEWAFDDVNPPVHAWAAYRIYKIEAKQRGVGDIKFLERVFQKLLLNFTWWVNRKDVTGRNVFQGGFLGLDNIGVFDRSAQLPTGGYLAQADGTSWMGVYSLNMLAIAIELAVHDSVYEHLANKFFEHFLYIADAINAQRDDDVGLWDAQDEFYYDQLYLPSGERIPLKVRSGVGVIPIYAVETLDPETLEQLPRLKERVEWFIANRPELAENVARIEIGGMRQRRLLAIVNPDRLRRILRRVFSEDEFLGRFGMRALSKFHHDHPFELNVGGATFRVDYEPAESTSGLFGGNSNWRGPVWFPLNYLLIESLQKFHYYLGDGYRVEFPTGSGESFTLWEISQKLSHRLIELFRRGDDGARPFVRHDDPFRHDPHWADHLLFHEYFNGDTGEGLGASHQTGWTGLVAKLVQQTSEYESPHHPPVGADFTVNVPE